MLSLRTEDAVRIRLATTDDVPALAALESEVWGRSAAGEAQLAARIRNVPRGTFLAVAPDGRACGSTSFCMLDYDAYASRGDCSWSALSGDGTASTHTPGARDLFGINLGVAPWAPRGTPTRLLGEVVREGIRARARRGLLGARMPGYHRHAASMSAQEYWTAEHRPGIPLDPELRFYRRFGMRPIRLVEGYFEDPESLNWGVIMEYSGPKLATWLVGAAGPAIAALPIDLASVLEKVI